MFKPVGKTRVRTVGLWLLLALLLSACQPIMPVPIQPPAGLRPDAPPYAVHGPFAVGARDFVIGEGDDAIQMTVWYPALNPTHTKEKITYQLNEKVDSVPALPSSTLVEAGIIPLLPSSTLVLLGQAIQNASPDVANGPYPLVVFSVGLAGFRQQNGYLPEHLASYGMVVLSGDPRGETLFEEFWVGAATRQIDAKRMIAYADELTASGGEWAGLIDTEHIATVGHSSGGWAALAGGGAQMDFSWCTANPDLITNEMTNCTQFPAHQDEIAAMLGLESTPETLWPATNDARVDAVIALAPDGDIWGAEYEGVAVMKVPTMVMGGSGDSANIPEITSYPIYEHLGSANKSLVVLENADHWIFTQPRQDTPWVGNYIPYFVSTDPVWDMDRAHDLINHFATAFLLDTLKGDKEAHAALLPEAVNFPGVEYATTMK